MIGAAAGLLAACGSGGQPPSRTGTSASCVGPTLAISPTVAHAGDTVQANGEWFAADCYDTGQPGTPPALTAMTIRVSQSGKTWLVAAGIDAAGARYAFHVPIQLPERLRPGTAEVEVPGHGTPTELRIRRH